MLRYDIPNMDAVIIENLILDFNGTIAIDGILIAGVAQRLRELSSHLTIHVLTADTNETARNQLESVPCKVEIIGKYGQDEAKLAYAIELGPCNVAAIGNGRNDTLLLKNAAMGIAVIQAEGAAAETLQAAQIICVSINDALDLLLRPLRIIATLRN